MSFILICCIFWPVFGCCGCALQKLVKWKSFSGGYISGNKKHSTNVLVKTIFLLNFASNFLLFLAFFSFFVKKCWKSIFQPAFGVHSTQTWVKIYYTYLKIHLFFAKDFLSLGRNWISNMICWNVKSKQIGFADCTICFGGWSLTRLVFWKTYRKYVSNNTLVNVYLFILTHMVYYGFVLYVS